MVSVSREALVPPLPDFAGSAPRILIVSSPYYADIARELEAGARAMLDEAGASHETIHMPGALEIGPAIAMASGRYDGFVALGCVVRGETSHYDIVAGESARALIDLGLRGHAIGNGILTVDTIAQAEARAAADGQNKGGGAAHACLCLVAHARRAGGERGFRPSSEQILMASAEGSTRHG